MRNGSRVALLASLSFLFACGGTATPPTGAPPRALASPALTAACGDLKITGNVIRVSPSADDTENLQCAFDTARGHPGSVIRLTAGTFMIGPVFAEGFVGEVAGAGMDATLVRNTAGTILLGDMSTRMDRNNPGPFLMTFTDGKFRVHDLTVQVIGPAPTADWSVFPGVHAIAAAVVVEGHADAEFARVRLVGELAPGDPLFGYNLYNGIYFQQEFNGPPTSGSFFVHDSDFDTVGNWAPVGMVEDARVILTNNDIKNGGEAIELFWMTRTKLVVAQNTVQSTGPGLVYGPFDASTLAFIGNDMTLSSTSSGPPVIGGINVIADFANGSSCNISGNKLSASGDGPAIYLGPTTTHCLVTSNHGATVIDEGSGNHVVP